MIKAIIFDFFGVLCSDGYWDSVKHTEGRSEEFIVLSDEVSMGKISWKEFVARLAERTGKTEAELLAGYASQKINPELLAFIIKLRRSYKTALLTNASRETINLLTKDVPLESAFSEVLVSSDVGMIKPDPRFFQLALSRLAVKPEEAVFIDDSSKYIIAAKELGMETILYNNFGQMKAELVKLLAPGSNN